MLPQYPEQSYEEKMGLPDEVDPSASLNTINQVNFAQEVREERLSILWKVTLAGTMIMVWVMVVLGATEQLVSIGDMAPLAAAAIGCIVTGHFLRRGYFLSAVWAYGLGLVLMIGLGLVYGSDTIQQYAPFGLPIVVFIAGLLMPVRSTLILSLLAIGTAVIGPVIKEGAFDLQTSHAIAIALTVIAAALSAQVSGELFAIAEWALANYRRERQTTFALFESREALEKSFNRQRALAEELQETNLELEQARTAAEEAKTFRGQFLANMSHELRTPLNAIIGFSQTILDFPAMYEEVELPPQYRQDMNQILTSGKHLLTIINDILDISKVDAGKLDLEIQPVDLQPVIKGAMATAVGLVGDKGSSIQLLRDVSDPLPMILGDPLRVRQVLLNLYSNAAKFTDSGYIKLIITETDSEVIFGVEDTGMGIADADKMSIFEEFRQGTAGRKKGRKGAGLGLAISQQLLRLMNGRIWFDSVLGKGSTFYFALPKYTGQTDPAVAGDQEMAVDAAY